MADNNQIGPSPGILHEDDNSVHVITNDGQVAQLPKGVNPAIDNTIQQYRDKGPAMIPATDLTNPGGSQFEQPLDTAPTPTPMPTPSPTADPIPPNPSPMNQQPDNINMPPPAAPYTPPAPSPAQSEFITQEQKQIQTSAEKKNVDDKLVALEQSGADARKTGILSEAALKATQQDELAKAYRGQATALGTLNKNIDKIITDGKKDANDKLTNYKAAVDDYNKQKVDNDFFGRKDTGTTFAIALSVIMSGLGMGLAGRPGENPALDILNKAIDRDIDAQKANIAIKGKTVDQRRGLYADALDKTKNDEQAALLVKAQQLDVFNNQLKQLEASTQSPIIKANAQTMMGQLDQERANTWAQLTGSVTKTSVDDATSKAINPMLLKEAPEPAQKMITNAQQRLDAISDVKNIIGQGGADIGSIRGKVAEWKNKLGAGSAENAKLIGKLKDIYILKAVQETGTRPSETVLNQIDQDVSRISQNPQSFMALLEQTENDANRDIDRTRQAYSGMGRLPNVSGGGTTSTPQNQMPLGIKKQPKLLSH